MRKAVANERGDSETGTPQDGLNAKALPIEELRYGIREYAPTIAALYRDELERRAREANPLRAEVEARFGAPAIDVGDERTGDGIADDERSQMLWRAANPAKARARRREEQRRRDA
jgi:hypothetical protein